MKTWTHEDMKTWGHLCSNPQQDSCASGPHQKFLPCQCLDTIQQGKHWLLRNHEEPMNPFLYRAKMPPAAISFPSTSKTVSPFSLSFSRKSFPFCPFLHSGWHTPLVCACLTCLLYFRGIFPVQNLLSGTARSEIAAWTVRLQNAALSTPPSLLPQPMDEQFLPSFFCSFTLQLPKDRRGCSWEEMPPHPALGSGQTSREEELTQTRSFTVNNRFWAPQSMMLEESMVWPWWT